MIIKKYSIYALLLVLLAGSCLGSEKTKLSKDSDSESFDDYDGIESLESDATTKDLEKLLLKKVEIKKLYLRSCDKIDFEAENLNWNKVKNLEVLNLSSTNITAKGLQKILDSCKKLEILNLSYCNKINFEAENLNWEKVKNLEVLDLSSTNIIAKGLQKILESCKGLKVLNLSNCNKINFNKIKFKTFKELKSLDLSFTNITATKLQKILVYCKRLKKLNLSNCNEINFGGLKFEKLKSDNFTKLKVVDISSTKINKNELEKVFDLFTKIENLNLSGCENIKIEDFKGLNWKNCRQYKVLNLSVTNIDKKGLENVLKNCPDLEVLFLTGCLNLKERLRRKIKFEEINQIRRKMLGIIL